MVGWRRLICLVRAKGEIWESRCIIIKQNILKWDLLTYFTLKNTTYLTNEHSANACRGKVLQHINIFQSFMIVDWYVLLFNWLDWLHFTHITRNMNDLDSCVTILFFEVANLKFFGGQICSSVFELTFSKPCITNSHTGMMTFQVTNYNFSRSIWNSNIC